MNELCVSYKVNEETSIQLNAQYVRDMLFRGTNPNILNDQDIMFFMQACKAQKLNPLVNNEVYLVKYKSDQPAQVVIGKAAYLRRAFENPSYITKEDGIIVSRPNGDIVKKEGSCLYPREVLVGGWCRVHFLRNGSERTAYKEVAFAEYDKGRSCWKELPATMITKVAICQAIREAFPKEFSGLYAEDELVASGAIDVEATVVEEASVVDHIDRLITRDENKAFQQLIVDSFHDRETGNNVYRMIIDMIGVSSSAQFKLSDWERAKAKVVELAENRNHTEDGMGE